MKKDASKLESNFFSKFLQDVQPLKSNNDVPPESPKCIPFKKYANPSNTSSNYLQNLRLSDPTDDYSAGESILSFCQGGIRSNDWRKLKKGKSAVQNQLDLHGQTVEEARKAVEFFLINARQRGLTHLKLIHGKGHHGDGRGILKRHVNHWLRQIDFILAFHSCLPEDGGNGAIYILLKKPSRGIS